MEFFIESLTHILAFNACPTRLGSLFKVCPLFSPAASIEFRFFGNLGVTRVSGTLSRASGVAASGLKPTA